MTPLLRRGTGPDAVHLSTTPSIAGYEVEETLGIVTAEWVGGVNLFRDFFAGVRDIVGGRSASLERALRDGRQACLMELQEEAYDAGAHGVVGVKFDYSPFGKMLLLAASGTAVRLIVGRPK
jgi:uncharacterized protein YbjQ (UPF0145 family)